MSKPITSRFTAEITKIPEVDSDYSEEPLSPYAMSFNECSESREETYYPAPSSEEKKESFHEEIFQIKNLDTGEVFDVRDESKEAYVEKAIKVMSMGKQPEEIEEYFKMKRHMNNLLWESVERNDIDAIERLLSTTQHGNLVAQPNAKGLNEWTPLHIAAADGFTEALQCLITLGERADIDARTSMYRTPLHLACLHGHLSTVKTLIKNKADINSIDVEQNTPLHYAGMYGHFTILKWLLKQMPDIYKYNYLNKTIVDVAMNIECYLAILAHCSKYEFVMPRSPYSRTPFYNTILHNSRADVINKILLKASASPNSRDLQTFNERPKPEFVKHEDSEALIYLPPAKVGPNDFKGLFQLGKGSFGEVFLVEKIDTGEQFALKVLRKDKVFGSNLIKYALTERNILMKIDHPYIVKLNYSFQTPEKLVLVMDYCPNGDLGSLMGKERKLPEERARFYISEILLALEELHKHGIIFRDLKPENVVLDADGHARLTDFGLSKEGVTENTLAKSFCGSVAYLAPEMLRRSGHTRSVDWYLLGVLLYELLVGSPPYYSSNREELFNNIQRGKLRIPKAMSESAKNIIVKLLNRDPSKRLGASRRDAEEIKEDPFFEGVDWVTLYERRIDAPPMVPSKKVFRDIHVERMFGKMEAPKLNHLDDWSFMIPLKK